MLKAIATRLVAARQWLARPDFWPRTLMELLQIAGGIVVFVGAVAATYEYRAARDDLRVTRTLELVQRFDDDELALGQREVNLIAERAAQEVAQASGNPSIAGLGEPEKKVLRARIIVEASYGLGPGNLVELSPAINSIVGYFDGLQICVERKVCDGEIAHAFLDSYAESFWSNFQPLVLYERGNRRPNFGLAMERYVRAAGFKP